MSDDMNEVRLKGMKGARIPSPSAAARQRALSAAMTAFEAQKSASPEKSTSRTQGTGWVDRLKSIFSTKRTWTIMDYRIPLGTAAVALLLLPLGWQLYSSTSMTPVGADPAVVDRTQDVAVSNETDQRQDSVVFGTEIERQETGEASTALALDTMPDPNLVEGREQTVTVQSDGSILVDKPAEQPVAPGATELALGGEATPGDAGLRDTATAMPKTIAEDGDADVLTRDMPASEPMVAPMTTAESAGLPADAAGSVAMEESADLLMPLPSPEPGYVEPEQSGDEFTQFEESPLKQVADEPVSTFSIDVDTASYSYVRRSLIDGFLPEPSAVRIEEMINYFPYDYPAADSTDKPFEPTMAIYPTPWNPKTQLLHIGIKGYVPPVVEDVENNLVFLIDTSGSMDEPNKLPLVKRSFNLLLDQLNENDTISIVVYAGSAGVVLEPTKATERVKILEALDNLMAGGSTAGAEGIELAYDLAAQNFVEGGNNRVVLATDGDFNVGISDPTQLIDFVKEKRETGVFLSVLGFGLGNYQDDTMQALAQNGNGNAAYIDTFQEAQKVLVEEAGSTLMTIAKDVKIQIEFNPAFVSEYRLIGYETRALNREDFNNDRVDAGDIGAGHTVTAIYEITPAGESSQWDPLRFGEEETTTTVDPQTSNEIAYLKLRYKAPDSDTSQLMEVPVTTDLVLDDISKASDDIRFAAAVAAFAQKLKDSGYINMTWDAIRDLAQGARGEDENGYRNEFMQLVRTAESLT